MKIKKGDNVKVISGKDKGKTGSVIKVIPEINRVIIENVNIHTKFERSRRPGQPGQKIQAPAPIAVSKVMLIDSNSGKPTRVGYTFLADGTKQRTAKASGKAV